MDRDYFIRFMNINMRIEVNEILLFGLDFHPFHLDLEQFVWLEYGF
jgi:hypothetical protein